MKLLFSTTLLLLCPLLLFGQDFRSFKTNELYGYIQDQKTVIQPEYNYAFEFKGDLALVKKGNYWGFIDKKNRTVIPFSYDRCSEFSEGFALVIKNGKSGIIDAEGKTIVPTECSYVEVLKNGYCIGEKDDKFALFKGGDQLTQYAYDAIGSMYCTLFHFKLNEKYGVLDASGKQLISERFYSKPSCYQGRKGSEGFQITGNYTKNGPQSIFSSTGTLILDGDYYDVNSIIFPTIFRATKDGKTKVVNVFTGETLLPMTAGITYYNASWRPCDGYGYKETSHLFFKQDSSFLMVSLYSPKNTVLTKELPIVFEEFLLVPTSKGKYDLYGHDLQLVETGVGAIIDKMGVHNSEDRICSISERSLLLWKDGKFAQWNAASQSLEFVSSAPLDEKSLFNPEKDRFGAESTISVIYFDENHILYEIVTGNTKEIYFFKDFEYFWYLTDAEADAVVKLKKLQYEDFLDGDEQYHELYNVILKIGGKKEHFGW